jgi:BirA family biotin operon repressor/biotin-[acetyl-CoA-carboxylase] ligase
LAISNQFDLNRVISLGVCGALTTLLGEKVRIKWPNDIYYEDKKLGGILIENLIQGDRIKNSVIGIGLNINQEFFPDAAANAISVKQILQKDYDLRVLLAEICQCTEAWYLQLKAGKTDEVRGCYLNRLYWLNEYKMFKAESGVFEGVITGVEDSGLIVVQSTNGNNATFSLKEIEFLNK